jgi:hypothetical protein
VALGSAHKHLVFMNIGFDMLMPSSLTIMSHFLFCSDDDCLPNNVLVLQPIPENHFALCSEIDWSH